MLSVVVVAHCPASGVKVYVVVAVLFSAGLHVPVIPLLDVVGSADSVAPLHIAATGVKVGVMFGLTVMVVLHVVLEQPFDTVHVMVDMPMLNEPLASLPAPFLVVAPVIW
jgi:hypothetical protein